VAEDPNSFPKPANVKRLRDQKDGESPNSLEILRHELPQLQREIV